MAERRFDQFQSVTLRPQSRAALDNMLEAYLARAGEYLLAVAARWCICTQADGRLQRAASLAGADYPRATGG